MSDEDLAASIPDVCVIPTDAMHRRSGQSFSGLCGAAPLVELGTLAGESITAAGTAPALATACDELVGPGRWASPVNCSGAVMVRFPSGDRADAGYHVQGSYEGPSGYWVNVHSRGRGLLALFLLPMSAG